MGVVITSHLPQKKKEKHLIVYFLTIVSYIMIISQVLLKAPEMQIETETLGTTSEIKCSTQT